MISLGLDPSYHTGWAVDAGNGQRPASGLWELPKAPSLRVLGPTCLRAEELLEGLLRRYEVKVAAIEEPFQSFGARNSETQIILWAINSTFQRTLTKHNIETVLVPPRRWRLFFLGEPNLKADEAKARAVQKCRDLDWPAIDHNAAEAVGVWAWLKAGNEPGWEKEAMPGAQVAKITTKYWHERRATGGSKAY